LEKDSIFISIAAPVYNEEDVIEDVVRHWFRILNDIGKSYEIVLGDGGSNDQTLEILTSLCEEFPNLNVVQIDESAGYGVVLFNAIYATKGTHIVILDADGQFDLSDCRPMLDMLLKDSLDAVTGYRIRKKDTFIRVFADRILNLIVRAMFGLNRKDTNCALKVIKGEIIRNMCIEAKAWPCPTEIMIRLNAQGYKVGEVGIAHYERKGGDSKLKVIRTSLEMLAFLMYMKFKLSLYRKHIIVRI
jgi:glycosyltransferase involved in cell wall biosynthesis